SRRKKRALPTKQRSNPKAPMTKSNSSKDPQTTEMTNAPKRLLDGIRSPADIKALREQDLPQLAQEVRDELIKVLSRAGGHLGPNLGVVELTIALHRVFDTPRDRFVMDVSHQGYVHKMFTGRLGRFHTMRQFSGLNGFLLRTESEHDCYGAGHAVTALSHARAQARRFPQRSAWPSGAIYGAVTRTSWSSQATPPLRAESVTKRLITSKRTPSVSSSSSTITSGRSPKMSARSQIT